MEPISSSLIDDDPAVAFLVALDTGCAQREYRIGAAGAVVGRDGADCEVVVAGATVSRRHLRIAVEGQGFRVDDLDSTNGVFINGRRIDGSARFSVARWHCGFSLQPECGHTFRREPRENGLFRSYRRFDRRDPGRGP